MHDRGQTDRHSTGCPEIKWACAKRLQEEALCIARAGAEEPKTHNGGQTDRHSTGHPEIKWACAKRLQEETLYMVRVGARRPFKMVQRSKRDQC